MSDQIEITEIQLEPGTGPVAVPNQHQQLAQGQALDTSSGSASVASAAGGQMPAGEIRTPNVSVQVVRDGKLMTLGTMDSLQWGDEIRNESGGPLTLFIPARSLKQTDSLIEIPAAGQVKLEKADSGLGDGESRTKVLALTEGVEIIDQDPEAAAAYLDKGEQGGFAGLFGAGLLGAGSLGGAGVATAAVGAVALGAVLESEDDNLEGQPGPADGNGTAGGANTGGTTGTPLDTVLDPALAATAGTPLEAITAPLTDALGAAGGSAGGSAGGDTGGAGGEATGLSGGVDALSSGVEQTPLAPATALTTPLADGLSTVADGVAGASAQDPSGIATLLADTVGVSSSDGGSDASGLVGTVNSLSTGLDAGASQTPLAPVVDPLAQTLGSDSGSVDGVAEGLGDVGNTLSADGSPLSPLTSEVLGPVVGTVPDSSDSNGLPGTLDQVGEGLTDLTNSDSALAPLSALTEPVSDSAVTPLSDGVETAGTAIVDASAQDPSGLATTVGELLGGDTSAPMSSSASPLDMLPLDSLPL